MCHVSATWAFSTCPNCSLHKCKLCYGVNEDACAQCCHLAGETAIGSGETLLGTAEAEASGSARAEQDATSCDVLDASPPPCLSGVWCSAMLNTHAEYHTVECRGGDKLCNLIYLTLPRLTATTIYLAIWSPHWFTNDRNTRENLLFSLPDRKSRKKHM